MKMADTFFGGADAAKGVIANAIQQKRMAKGMTCEQLDCICGFDGQSLPSSAQFEKQTSLVTGQIFSRAAFPLRLKINSVLPLNLDQKNSDAVIGQMHAEGSHVTAACGGGDVSKIAIEKQVPVYIYLKLIQELGQ